MTTTQNGRAVVSGIVINLPRDCDRRRWEEVKWHVRTTAPMVIDLSMRHFKELIFYGNTVIRK